jgi:hypothetical protein
MSATVRNRVGRSGKKNGIRAVAGPAASILSVVTDYLGRLNPLAPSALVDHPSSGRSASI